MEELEEKACLDDLTILQKQYVTILFNRLSTAGWEKIKFEVPSVTKIDDIPWIHIIPRFSKKYRFSLNLSLNDFWISYSPHLFIKGHHKLKCGGDLVIVGNQLVQWAENLRAESEFQVWTREFMSDTEIVKEFEPWLIKYGPASETFSKISLQIQENNYNRTLLDELRLCLEQLLKQILNNEKSLENQQSIIADFLKEKGGSKYMSNLFWNLLKTYTDYQNDLVKHVGDDKKRSNKDYRLIIELTVGFMRYLILNDEDQAISTL